MEYMEEAQEVHTLNMGHMNIITVQHQHIRIQHVQKVQKIPITLKAQEPQQPEISTEYMI
jgi:hypothetical protein